MQSPIGVRLLAAFFVFGAFMSGLACAALLFPSSGIERVWRLNPHAGAELSKAGLWAIGLMAVVCVACGLSAFGLVKRLSWGRYLAIGVLAANVMGDAANALIGGDPRSLIGLPVGGLLIAYLLRPGIGVWFAREPTADRQID